MKLNQEQFHTYESLLPVQFIPTISKLSGNKYNLR
ncbi:MAG: hypothetical protein A4E70_01082 [Syntrophus sp. PtaU1.Bin005]|nr:MAG: hypothetical protein A4E70_01082 [Syntrophus sp. PtaU1.Bin005]